MGSADLGGLLDNGRLVSHIFLTRLAHAANSQKLYSELAGRLIRSAEHAYSLRDTDALEEAGLLLTSLPIDRARQIGLYYHGLTAKRRGQIAEAYALFLQVADKAPMAYRARAIQSLGMIHQDSGQLDDALRFQLEALRAASSKDGRDPLTILMAHLEISHAQSDKGDHKGALEILEDLSPLVRIVARNHPLYFYGYHNELSIELAELGRLEEAEAALAIALGSPYAPAYPEWSETRDEIEAIRAAATPSIVAVARAPETAPSICSQDKPGPDPQTVALSTTAAATRAPARGLITAGILDRLGESIRPRAPPTLLQSY
jgi:tetratricopeptide (TPR) repeat protein